MAPYVLNLYFIFILDRLDNCCTWNSSSVVGDYTKNQSEYFTNLIAIIIIFVEILYKTIN